MSEQKKFNVKLAALLLFIPPVACFGTGLSHPDIFSIFITIIGLWLTEAVPLPVTGLLVPLLAAIYGSLPAARVFEPFGSDILYLFLGCFLMGRSMEKYGFEKRLAYFLLGRCMPGTSLFAINLVLALTSYFLSMWISNTSATAILSAITIGILSSLENQVEDPRLRKLLSARLLLTCAFAASIGGLATPVGSPPNLIALKFLSMHGIEITFLEWMKIGLPISFCMLVLMLAVFHFIFPLKKITFPGIHQHFQKLLKELGPMKTGEAQIAIIFLAAISLWVLPGILNSIFPNVDFISMINSRLSMSVVGLVCGLSTFFLPVIKKNQEHPNLEWSETDKIEWGTLMLFGGGLTLGLLLESSGAAAEIGNYLFSKEISSPLMLGSIIVIVSILMSEFASNTAAASILIPLIIGTADSHGFSNAAISSLVLTATFGASFGFMLPVSTPPNAIVYGTGRVPASAMRNAGLIFDICGVLLIIFYMLILK